jgi:hypothetical protein
MHKFKCVCVCVVVCTCVWVCMCGYAVCGKMGAGRCWISREPIQGELKV